MKTEKEKLQAKTVDQLKRYAKKVGAKIVTPDGKAKSKEQLVNSIVMKQRLGGLGERQTGATNKRVDVKRKAKAPGKRTSASGKTYYERRKNRTDKSGSMLGTNNNRLQKLRKEKWTTSTLLYEMDFDVASYDVQRTSIDQRFIDKINNSYAEEVSPFVYSFEGVLYSTCLPCIAKAKIKYIRNERSAFMDYTSYAIDQLKKY